MIDAIFRIAFLIIGVFSVSTFFGGITNNIMVAGISALVTFVLAILIAYIYRRKTGRPIVR